MLANEIFNLLFLTCYLDNKNESEIFKWQVSTYVLATLLVVCLTMIIIFLVLFTLSLKKKLLKCKKNNSEFALICIY